MAGKKSTAKKKDGLRVHAPPEVLKLDDLVRLQLLRRSAEMGSAQAQGSLKAAALTAYLKQLDPQGRIAQLQAEVDGFKRLYTLHAQAYADLCEEVSQKLSIKMQEYAFDDETGVLTPLSVGTP